MRIILPFPPTINTYCRHIAIGGQPRTLISKKGRDYRTAVVKECMMQKIGRTAGRLSVHMDAHPPDERLRDLDNLPKAVLDALTHAQVWKDDSQIDRICIERKPKLRDGAIIVTIESC